MCVAKCDVKEEDEEERDARAKCVVSDEEEEDGWPVAGVGSEDEDDVLPVAGSANRDEDDSGTRLLAADRKKKVVIERSVLET